jgi:hypothetical protein
MTVEASRTFHATQAVQISELLTIRFANETWGTTVPRRIEVTEPDGPSTDGGAKARQTIMLSPPDGGDGRAIVCGFIDVKRRMADIRGFAALSQQYQQRFGDPVDITRGEYDRFLKDVVDFLKQQGLETHVSNTPPVRSTARSSQPAAAVSPIPTKVIALATVFGMILGLFLGFIIWGS